MSRQKLMDRVYLTCIPSEKFKTSFLSAQIAAPLEKETAGCNALMVNVLSRGTVRCPDMASIGRELDLLYGARLEPTVRKKGENQLFGFVASCIDDRFLPKGEKLLEKLTDLLGEFFCMPVTRGGRLLEAYVESERENLADMIRSDINDKRAYAARRLLEEMCAGERYAVDKLGDGAQAKAMTAEALWTAYQALLPAAKVTFYYGGSAGPERVEEAVRRSFAPLLTGRTAPVDCQVEPEPRGPVRTVVDSLDVTQGKLAMGFRTGGITMGSGGYPALLVCNALYGGSANSKLFLNVREKMSLCYYASSMLDKVKGLMVVSSGVEFAQFDRAQEAILDQLEAVRRGDFTQEELTAAIRTVTGSLRGRQDSQGQMEDDRLTGVLFHAAAGEDGELIKAVEAVTADQVAGAAQKLKLDTIFRLTGKEG